MGLILTAPLITLFYIGDQVLGLPFIPFDLFDWLARILPGEVITRVIDVMVDLIITLNLGETSSAAKRMEQLLAILTMFGMGAASGVLLFAVRFVTPFWHFLLITALGAALGYISMLVNSTATADPMVSLIYTGLVFMLWGAAFGEVYARLKHLEPVYEGRSQAAIQSDLLDRRRFLVQLGSTSATLTIVGAGLGRMLRIEPETITLQINSEPEVTAESLAQIREGLPNADADVRPAPGTRAELTAVEDHYRIDINSRPPRIGQEDWRLDIQGMVLEPQRISISDLINDYEPVDQYVTLSCISNPVAGDLISTVVWTGIPLMRLLDAWGVAPGATHMFIESIDSFDEYLDLSIPRHDERVMLCYAWNGEPLPQANGFPLRIYIPDRYGMKQPKWITRITFQEGGGDGSWVRRGWSEEALVRATSVVDTISADHAYERDGVTYVPVGGIAYAGARGISGVEVSIDDGPWIKADLRDPLSGLTWVLWRYDWPFEPGEHSFVVRAVEGDGTGQITQRNGTRPDGATGLHSKSVNIEGAI